jgi:hypothetical protein
VEISEVAARRSRGGRLCQYSYSSIFIASNDVNRRIGNRWALCIAVRHAFPLSAPSPVSGSFTVTMVGVCQFASDSAVAAARR